MENNNKSVRVIEHSDGTYSIPFSSFTIKKPSYNGKPSKTVTCRFCVPIDKEDLIFE